MSSPAPPRSRRRRRAGAGPARHRARRRARARGAPDELLADGAPDEQLAALLARTPATSLSSLPRDATPEGPVLVPFGGAEHDWAAVELGAWLARAGRARSGSPAPRQCQSTASATRAACCHTGARGAAGPRHLGRAAADAAGGEGHAAGEPRRGPARRRPVDEVAPRGTRAASLGSHVRRRRPRCSSAEACARAALRLPER